jgi:hypothetical protein
VSYVLLHADLTGLDEAAADAFVGAAADLGLDVIDLTPDLADAEIIVLISTSLAALTSKLAERIGEGAAEKFCDLIRRLRPQATRPYAVEDGERKITFVFDQRAQRAGPAAVAGMMAIGAAMQAIDDGVTLRWDSDTCQWSADTTR